jgi:quercetin dioxygenase-like cupin family protein
MVAFVVGLVGCASWRHKAEPTAQPAAAAPEAVPGHVMLTPATIKWQPFPPGGPKAKFAVLSGDPEKKGPFVMRIRQPAGAKVPPHWHPTDENVTVIKGTIYLGMGEKFHKRDAHEFSAGSYILLPAKQPHFAWVAKAGEGIVQVHGMGPFVINYVNPADDPRGKPTKP